MSTIDDLVPTTEMSGDSLKWLWSHIEKSQPELWKSCYPRIYHEPKCGQYYSPKEPAHQMIGVAHKWNSGVRGQSEAYEFLVMSQLARFRVPMFWLGRDMATAIRQTIPPMDIDWYNMQLPFEAMIFMMPKGSLVHPTEGDVSFIGFARLRKCEEHPSLISPGETFASWNGAMVLICKTEVGGHLMHWNIPYDTIPIISIPDLDNTVMRYAGSEHEHRSGWHYSPVMTHEDNLLLVEVGHYIFGTLLVMNAKPNLITPAKLIKRVKRDKTNVQEFWSPNVIGEHYQIRRVVAKTSLGGTHASPRFHWVRGSYKQQVYGPQGSLRKEIWIEPYTRGGEAE